MYLFSRSLPRQFNQPVPEMMAQLTPVSSNRNLGGDSPGNFEDVPKSQELGEADIRDLADAVAAWHFWSPLGICLRRSLLRYHFLRAANVPVVIVFGARLKSQQEGGGLGGHAWLTLHGQPYFENPGDYEGFAAMYVYPQDVEP